jgi:hypothetical protein
MLTATATENRTGASVRREIRIGPATTFYEITGTALPPPTDLNDFVLLATIFYAMRAGEPLHITGCVSRTILQNIEEFQEAWALWRPNEYRVVKVSADEERAPCSTSTKCGVFAFSGGVDGTFALLKHHFNDAGRRTCIPAVMMLIHGFDIPLAQSSAFAIAEAVARDFSETLGVPLATVRTDWKTSLCKHWELEFGAAVGACLGLTKIMATLNSLGGLTRRPIIFYPATFVFIQKARDSPAPPAFSILPSIQNLPRDCGCAGKALSLVGTAADVRNAPVRN